MSYPTAGVPRRAASVTVRPQPSRTEQPTSTSAAVRRAVFSSCETDPGRCTASARPSSGDSRSSRSRSRPSPAMVSVADGWLSRRMPSARIAWSYRFDGVRRPTATSRPPRALAASDVDRGRIDGHRHHVDAARAGPFAGGRRGSSSRSSAPARDGTPAGTSARRRTRPRPQARTPRTTRPRARAG